MRTGVASIVLIMGASLCGFGAAQTVQATTPAPAPTDSHACIPPPSAPPRPVTLTLSPAVVQAGQSGDLLVSVDADSGIDLDCLRSRSKGDPLLSLAFTGSDLSLNLVSLSKTSALYRYNVHSDVSPETLTAVLSSTSDKKLLAVVPLRLNANPADPMAGSISAAPTPLGMHQVDVMWSVLPDHVTQDNFGSHVKKDYWAVQVMIGNNSGHDLMLSGIGFSMGGNPSDGPMHPAASFPLVRGTVQAEESALSNLKTVADLAATAAGGVGVALQPAIRKRTYATKLLALTGLVRDQWPQVENRLFGMVSMNGIENRLTDSSLQGGTILRNNTQMGYVVFVPKETLRERMIGICGVDSKTDDGASEPCPATRHLLIIKSSGWKTPSPEIVQEALGSVQIIGQRAQFLNRMVVASAAPGPLIREAHFAEGKGGNGNIVTITGAGFAQGMQVVMVKPGGTDWYVPGSDVVSVSPTEITARFTPAISGAWGVEVRDQTGRSSNQFNVEENPEIIEAVYQAKGTGNTLILKGERFSTTGATIILTSNSGEVVRIQPATEDDIRQDGATLQVGPTKWIPGTETWRVRIENPDQTTSEDVTVAKKS